MHLAKIKVTILSYKEEGYLIMPLFFWRKYFEKVDSGIFDFYINVS